MGGRAFRDPTAVLGEHRAYCRRTLCPRCTPAPSSENDKRLTMTSPTEGKKAAKSPTS